MLLAASPSLCLVHRLMLRVSVLFSFFKDCLFLVYVLVSVCACAYLSGWRGVYGDQKKVSQPLEVKLPPLVGSIRN